MRPFSCLVTILNTLDSLGKFDGKKIDGDAAFEEKEPEFEGRKPESEVHISPSSKFLDISDNNINEVNAAGNLGPAVGQIFTDCTNTFSAVDIPELEDITYSDDEEDVGTEADFTNLETSITVSPIPTTRVHKDHLVTQIIFDLSSATQTRSMTRVAKDQEPKKVHQALKDPSWIEAMREKLLQFKMQKVWVLVDLPNEKRAIGHTQEEGIDYEEVFAPVARIEAIRLFLAYASFMGFMMYQMDVKSAFLHRTIKEEVYVCQPLGFEDLNYPGKVYKVVKALYGLHQAPRACQDKYVAEILRKFGLTYGKSGSTPIDTEKPLLKDPDVKRIFRYLKGKPHLGLWYPKDLPFNLVAYLDSDYVGASLDRKSTTGGCQFLRCSAMDSESIAGLWPDASEGFNQIIDFLNGSSIKYALTVNPNIYVSCIKQFWSSVAVKKVNNVTRFQALVDKKKVIVTEATIRDAFRLDDAEGIECLPNGEIFTELSRMGLVRNVDSSTKFYMCPHFLQLMIRSQVGDLSSHTIKYLSSALIQKVFANMKRVGKGFSRADTPLFEGAASVADDDVNAVVDESSIPSPTPPTQPPPPSQDIPSTSQVQLTPPQSPQVQPPSPQQQPQPSLDAEISMDLLHTPLETWGIIANIDADEDVILEDAKEVVVEKTTNVKDDADVQGRQAESQAQIYQIDLEHANKVLSMQDKESKPYELQKVVKVVTTAKLITEVVTAASATITAADTSIPAAIITVASTLTTAPSATRRRNRVVIRDPKEIVSTPSTIIHTEPKSKDKGKGIMVHEPKPLKKKTQIEQNKPYARELEAELNKNIDWDAVLDQVKRKEKEDNAVIRYQALKRKPQTEAQARKNMMIYLKNMVGFKMDYLRGMSYNDICPIFEKYFNFNVAFLEKTKEQMEEEDSLALKRIIENQEDKAAKRQKLDEEVKELRRHLQIVPNDEDDVYTEAIPLALKVPIVDYEIYNKHNKPYYKIKRAVGSHQLYLSFLSMLKNFDREDLEALCTSSNLEKSKKCSWISEGQELEAVRILWCIDYHIYYNTIGFVGKEEISLTRFTLDQMLNNVRLKVEEDSEDEVPPKSKNDMSFQDKNSEEEVAETMAETMEQYISKTRADYGSGVARPKIENKDNFEPNGQFLKELRTNVEDANEHIEKVLEIADLFHIPNITIDQMMLRAFPMSLTRAARHWLRNKPTGSITTWDGFKTKFLNKYCSPARTAKKIEEINNFQQEPDENLYQACEQFKELLMKCPQHYLMKMQENRTLMYESRQMTISFPSRLNGYYCKEKKGSYGPQFSEAYSEASQSIPQKDKDPGSFTLPFFINNVCFDNPLVDLGASVSVMPLLTYLNLGLDAYRDEGIGDVIVGESFLREVGIKARWFE
nr:copia protein [Tanacetum cinerariifolium]